MQMHRVDKTILSRRCSRCAGPMFRDYDGVRSAFLCLHCGEYQFIKPPGPPGRGLGTKPSPRPAALRRRGLRLERV